MIVWEIEQGAGATTYRRRTDEAQIEIDARGEQIQVAILDEVDEVVVALARAGITRLEIGIPRIAP